ncbi:MAG: hypothetical protein A2W23_07535 [Planctomycetes bacterium RBG_16_43_13]|nr:MAG: hypothetical protein A2W23_07535 [Planctomycetes bacterium RBG_16_43_13]
MSITTIYKCDKCGNEQNSGKKFWTVYVMISGEYYTQSIQKEIYVCQLCLESFGILVPREKVEALPPPPTVEDLIREIMSMVQE